MKKFAAVCVVLALTACGEKKAPTPAVDTTAMRPDTTMSMSHDSMAAMHGPDSTMARDTAKKQ
jgi:hypothetical protein